MRISSWDYYGIDYSRMLGIAAGVGLGSATLSYLLTAELLGSASPVISLAVAAGFAYLVLTTPKRSLLRSALAQAREAPVLAASATIHLQTTGSRTKTLMMLESRESDLQDCLAIIRRKIVLGLDPRTAVRTDGVQPASDSVRRVLESVAEFSSGRITADSVELEGIQSSSALGEETKVPVFIAVAFFTPIMLVLFSALTKNTGVFALLSVLFLQIIVLDLAYTVSSAERQLLGS